MRDGARKFRETLTRHQARTAADRAAAQAARRQYRGICAQCGADVWYVPDDDGRGRCPVCKDRTVVDRYVFAVE